MESRSVQLLLEVHREGWKLKTTAIWETGHADEINML